MAQMMKMVLVSALMVLLATSALAKHEEISVGPYNISFDLNTTRNYSVTLHPESLENNSSSYMFDIIFDNDTKAAVGITKYNSWHYADFPCELWQRSYLKNDPKVLNFSISHPLIDGNKGQVISAIAPRIKDNKTVNGTVVEVWLDSKKIEGYDFLAGKTKVEMILLLPENLTRDLLTTFHAEPNENIKLETKAAADRSPQISVRTQTNADPTGMVIIPQVISNGPSYVVVFDESGNVLGYKDVADGANTDVLVELNQTPKSQWLYATLNEGGAVQTEYWNYPFTPDAVVRSNMFFDSRVGNIAGTSENVASVPPKGSSSNTYQNWLDTEKSTSRMDPFYDRDRCTKNMVANGYPPATASFYCD